MHLWLNIYRTGWRQDAKGTGRELTKDIKTKQSVAKLKQTGQQLVPHRVDLQCLNSSETLLH